MERWPHQNDKLIAQFKVNADYRKILFACDDFLKRVSEMKSETAKAKVVKCILDNSEIFSSVIKNEKSLIDFCTKFPAYKQLTADKYFVLAKARVATFKPKTELQRTLSKIPEVKLETKVEPVDVVASYFQVDKTDYADQYGHDTLRTPYHHFESISSAEMANLFVDFMEEHPDHHNKMFGLMKNYHYLKHLFNRGILEKISKMKSKETQNNIIILAELAEALRIKEEQKAAEKKAEEIKRAEVIAEKTKKADQEIREAIKNLYPDAAEKFLKAVDVR